MHIPASESQAVCKTVSYGMSRFDSCGMHHHIGEPWGCGGLQNHLPEVRFLPPVPSLGGMRAIDKQRLNLLSKIIVMGGDEFIAGGGAGDGWFLLGG